MTTNRNSNTATQITFADGTTVVRKHRCSFGSFCRMVQTLEAETGTKFASWTIVEGLEVL